MMKGLRRNICVLSLMEISESCLDLVDGGEFESLNDLEEYFIEIDYPKEFKF